MNIFYLISQIISQKRNIGLCISLKHFISLIKARFFSPILSIVFVFTLQSPALSQTSVKQWDKTFGGDFDDQLQSSIQTSDNGFLLAGFSISGVNGDKTQGNLGGKDYWVVKTDATGNKQWDKNFGGDFDDQLQSTIQTSDGGYLLAGFSSSNISGDKTDASRGGNDYWIVKIDANGNKLWDKTFGGDADDQLQSTIQTSDGGYLLAGFSGSNNSGDKTELSKGRYDYWIIKIDGNGIKQWDKTFGGNANDQLQSIIQTSNGNYVLVGYSMSGISGDKTQGSLGGNDYWILKIDANGNKLWDKTFGGDMVDELQSGIQTSDGGYLFAGYSESNAFGDKSEANRGGPDYWVIKTDANGTKQWDKTFGGDAGDFLQSGIQALDGGYLLAGYSTTGINGDKTEASLGLEDFWIVKIDANGNKQWDKTFGGNSEDKLQSGIRTSGGGYFLAGYSSSPISGDKTEAGNGLTDYWIIKITGETSNNKDIGVTELIKPKSECNLGTQEEVSVKIRNFESNAQSNFNVSITLNNTTITENVSDTVAPESEIAYTFQNKFNLSSDGQYQFKIYTSLPGDEDITNDTLSTTVTKYPDFIVTLSDDTTQCTGVTTQLSANGGSSYLWNTGATTPSISVTPNVTTTYTVTVTNLNGCIITDSTVIEVLPKEIPVITITNKKNFYCPGDSVALTCNLQNNIIWSNGKTTQSIIVTETGTYEVTFIGENGCQRKSSVFLYFIAPPKIITSKSATLCKGDSITLTVSEGAAFKWSTNATTQSIQVSPGQTITYTVTTTSETGCVFTNSIAITVQQLPSPGPVGKMLPADNSKDLSLPINFSWLPAANALQYDLYVWPSDSAKPTVPSIADINGINYLFKYPIPYGLDYKWQVVAKNSCSGTAGPTQSFTLRNLPDLVVNTIQVPSTGFSGQSVSISWEVKNSGSGNTAYGQWDDAVFISADTVLDLNTDTRLGYQSNQSFLNPNEAYSQTGVFTLPEDISGNYYLFVVTDFFSKAEEEKDANNVAKASTPLNITLTPPPDLRVTSVVTPGNAFSGQLINVTWTVKNIGAGRTRPLEGRVLNWEDKIYLSADNTLEIHSAYELGSSIYADTLYPDSAYTITKSVRLPQGVLGTYYVYLKTDVNNTVLENAFEANNVTGSDSITLKLTPPADLVVTNILMPDNISSNEKVTIAWTIKNQGISATYTNWTDLVYLTPVNKPDSIIALGTFYHYNTLLDKGDSTSSQMEVTIPLRSKGDYYVSVQTDIDTTNKDATIFEYQNENNNTLKRDKPIHVLNPDLQVSNISAPSYANSGQAITINYTSMNGGQGTQYGMYVDHIFLSKTAVYNRDSAIGLQDLSFEGPIIAGKSIIRQVSVTIPATAHGTYYVFVSTDAENTVFENTGEGNNIVGSGSALQVNLTWADLQVSPAAQFPSSPTAGDAINLTYTLKNSGTSPIYPGDFWKDAVYLSRDSVWAGNGIKISTVDPSRPLAVNESIAVTATFNLSFDQAPGKYFLYVQTDHFNFIFENQYENNNTQRLGVMNIQPFLPPDLIIDTFIAPATGISGQPSVVDWIVTNNGAGPTKQGSWTERFYLSPDLNIEITDPVLGTFGRNGNLEVNQSYNAQQEVFPPVWVSGNYYLLMRTDNNNSIYEGVETNNIANSLITITQPPPSDLIVSAVNIPSQATAGETVTIDWTLKNIGPNAAKGVMKQAVYFSKDSVWDVSDPLFGVHTFPGGDTGINLLPTATKNWNLKSQVPALTSGDYYVLVKTDVVNNIFELNDNNNTTASVGKIAVKINEFVSADTLLNNVGLYYQFEVPDSLAGETLILTLTGDSINGNNEMYVSYGYLPTRVNYEYSYSDPFSGKQEVIIPSLQAGTYYVLVFGYTVTGAFQHVALSKAILPFEIRSIQANKGGNTGSVTVKIKGAKFEEGMKAKLKNNTSGNTLTAYDIVYIDPLTVFASFNLNGVDKGFYDVVVEKTNSQTATLTRGFEVESGIAQSLLTNILHPESTRPGQIVIMSIQFTNNGNTDIPLPERNLLSIFNHSIAFEVGGLKNLYTSLHVVLQELNGPTGVLRPGAIGVITVYAYADLKYGREIRLRLVE